MTLRTEKITAWIAFILLLIALLPVMYLGRYNHPTGDDYYYGAETRVVWQETGSIMETIAEAARGVAREYEQWQGTYSALFLMYLPPNVFGNWAYRLVTAVMLSFLTGGIFYLLKPVICNGLKASVPAWVTVSACTALLCVETVPFRSESFFWYNGSMYYTGYLALSFFFFGMVLRYLRKPGAGKLAVLVAIALFLAGGNYVTLLPGILIMLLLSGWLIWQKKSGAAGCAVVTLSMLAGLLISAGAPGNRIRQDGMWKIPAWKAIAKSLLQGLRYTGAWGGICWVSAAFVITLILWKYLKKCRFRFPCPVIVIGLLYGIFCSMSCPTFYTMNSTGPARAVAAVYYSFLLFSLAAYVYLCGYLLRKRRKRRKAMRERQGAEEGVTATLESPEDMGVGKEYYRRWACAVGAGGAVLVILMFVTGSVSDFTTIRAIRVLASGEAQAYEQEYMERYRLLTDESRKELVLTPYVNQPDMLYVGDFSEDPQEPTCVKAAKFFGKASVCVDYDNNGK